MKRTRSWRRRCLGVPSVQAVRYGFDDSRDVATGAALNSDLNVALAGGSTPHRAGVSTSVNGRKNNRRGSSSLSDNVYLCLASSIGYVVELADATT